MHSFRWDFKLVHCIMNVGFPNYMEECVSCDLKIDVQTACITPLCLWDVVLP